VKQQHQRETLPGVGCPNVQERLVLDVKFSAGQDLKVVGMSLMCNCNCCFALRFIMYNVHNIAPCVSDCYLADAY